MPTRQLGEAPLQPRAFGIMLRKHGAEDNKGSDARRNSLDDDRLHPRRRRADQRKIDRPVDRRKRGIGAQAPNFRTGRIDRNDLALETASLHVGDGAAGQLGRVARCPNHSDASRRHQPGNLFAWVAS